MSTPKNQHWLPQFYLRPFCTPDSLDSTPRLWTFYRNGPEEPRLMSVEKIATKRYLYSTGDDATGRDHTVDVRLQDLEAMFGPIWPHLTEGFLPLENEAIRKALSLFIATLYTRHPCRIKDIESIHQQIVQTFDRFPKDAKGNPAVTHIEMKGRKVEFDASSWLAYKTPSKPDFHKKSFVDNIVSGSGGIAKLLLQKRWAIVVSDEPVFATCDNPLVLTNSQKSRFGFRTPGTTLYLPLSPTRFLIIEDKGLPDGYYETKPRFPEAMNYQTWCAADRYLLSSIPSDLILQGIMSFADQHGLS